MYFSHNVTYYFKPSDSPKFKRDGEFISMDEMRLLEENKIRHIEETKRKEQEELQDFLEKNFSKEEIEFLINNWEPPTS